MITRWLAIGALIFSAIEIVREFFAITSSCDAAGPPVCGIRFVASVFVYLALAGIFKVQTICAGLSSRQFKRYLGIDFVIVSVLFLAGGIERFFLEQRRN